MTKKSIIIADDDFDLVESLATRCEALGLKVTKCYDGHQAVEAALKQRPDAIILDVSMPGNTGLSVTELLTANKDFHQIPIIINTGSEECETIRRCFELCAYYVPKRISFKLGIGQLLVELFELNSNPSSEMRLDDSESTRPTAMERYRIRLEDKLNKGETMTKKNDATKAPNHHDPTDIIDAIFSLLEVIPEMTTEPEDSGRPKTPWILHVDDDVDLADAFRSRMEPHGMKVVHACDGAIGVRAGLAHTPNVILLDYQMPNLNGDEVIRRLKRDPATREVPIIVLSGVANMAIRQQLLQLGADAFLTKPYEFSELKQLIEKLAMQPS